MQFVHYCAACATAHEATGTTLVDPCCERCGCAMKCCDAAEWPAIAASLDGRPVPRPPQTDSMGLLAWVAVGPFLLVVAGIDLRHVVFAAAALLLTFAAFQCFAVVGHGQAWKVVGVAAALGAAATVVSGFAPHTLIGFHLGAVASAVLLAGIAIGAAGALRRAPADRLLDAALMLLLVLLASVFFLVEPGFSHGDDVLTAVVIVDLLALTLAGMATIVASSRRVLSRILTSLIFVVAGDGAASATAAGQIAVPTWVVVAIWAVAGWFMAAGAIAAQRPSEPSAGESGSTARWLLVRVAAPMSTLVAVPAMLALAIALEGPSTWSLAWFGGGFLVAVTLTFARHGVLLVDHRRAVVEERGLRHEATRRNDELEALTGLATTMTQTLEEAPIVEQALGVLHLAARASSSALHIRTDGRLRVRATAGDWQGEHPWADRLPADALTTVVRGRRQVTRFPLAARGHEIGAVTFIRPAADALSQRDLRLLGLLVDQMAVAVQNARDYREKLEQAVRDPLTGLYNRRYFFEALEKEIQRSRRYGSTFSLVLLDVDNFKQINDVHGHASGDAVLRGIGETAERLLRPADSFARIGGEEFAMLLPETEPMDALLVAERLRTAIGRREMIPGARVTVSGGVGTCPQDATDRESLVKRTDNALYWAKRNGRDLCAVVSDATDDALDAPGPATALAHLSMLVAAIDAQHLHTRDHSENVALYAVALGQAVGLSASRLTKLRRAALLHDIGKVVVRSEVLGKAGPLTDEEMAEIRLHPSVGATMLNHSGLAEEATWVRHHHERFDGAGYPDRLAGDEIPLEARIIFVADSFEAMTSDRPYRRGMDVQDALAELLRCAGTQFEPSLVEAFCDRVRAGQLEVVALRGS